MQLIKEYLIIRRNNYALTNDEPLFIGKKHYRLTRSQVYRFLNDVCSELGIVANIGTHSMRKTFGFFFY